MTADLLRRAAARAVELADGATPGEWRRHGGWSVVASPPDGWEGPYDVAEATRARNDAALIAACDPPFLRAVGEWLDVTARGVDPDRRSLSEGGPYVTSALAVARALLGEDEA
jgi:hypothetical protein